MGWGSAWHSWLAFALLYWTSPTSTAAPAMACRWCCCTATPTIPGRSTRSRRSSTPQGLRTIVPYLRGYGPTRFLSPDTPRSGQQAALGQDVLDLLDALQIRRAVLAGFDWGGRAACVVSALWPERVRGLVSCAGYQIQDIARGGEPVGPEQELRFWYQHYFQTERGRKGLAERRGDIGRLLWKLWSPTWAFDEATYARTASSFDNPDFVDVVIHSYRHRMGNMPGDPRYAALEAPAWRACPRSPFPPSFCMASSTT